MAVFSETDAATEALIAQLLAEDFGEVYEHHVRPIGSSWEDYEDPLTSYERQCLENPDLEDEEDPDILAASTRPPPAPLVPWDGGQESDGSPIDMSGLTLEEGKDTSGVEGSDTGDERPARGKVKGSEHESGATNGDRSSCTLPSTSPAKETPLPVDDPLSAVPEPQLTVSDLNTSRPVTPIAQEAPSNESKCDQNTTTISASDDAPTASISSSPKTQNAPVPREIRKDQPSLRSILPHRSRSIATNELLLAHYGRTDIDISSSKGKGKAPSPATDRSSQRTSARSTSSSAMTSTTNSNTNDATTNPEVENDNPDPDLDPTDIFPGYDSYDEESGLGLLRVPWPGSSKLERKLREMEEATVVEIRVGEDETVGSILKGISLGLGVTC